MKKSALIVLFVLVSMFINAQERSNQPNVAPPQIEQLFRQNDPLLIEFESFKLSADSGVLVHDLALQLSCLKRNQVQQMPSNMANATGDLADGYRLLPNGEHFSTPALITIPYDWHKIPTGYTDADVYSFFFDEGMRQWTLLERHSIDTIAHTITSYTTHFTDFANAVIKVPELPEAKAFVPTAITDLPDVNPLQGIPMIATPQANNRGTAELSYPIELPQGRRGLQPNIDLHYSSAGGNGILGVGWSIPIPAITIDTRWGVPRYDVAKETEVYLLNGEQLVRQESDGSTIPMPSQSQDFTARQGGKIRFYARDARNQDYIIRNGNLPNNYHWTVIDRSGTIYYYGYDPMRKQIDSESVLKDKNGNIAEWSLTAVVDLYGNYIRYVYNNDDNKEIYLESIHYTGNILTGLKPAHAIFFQYKKREDIILNGRLGFLREMHNTLCTIKILSNDTSVVSYILEYDKCGENSLYKTRLAAISKYDAYSAENCEPCGWRTMPWVVYNGMKDDKIEELEKKFFDLHTPDSISGSRTFFEYYDALPAENLFSTENSIITLPDLGKNINYSFGAGCAVTFGLSGNGTTARSIGANANLNYSTGRVKSMLIDLNGDALPDYVYEKDHRVYYKKQRADGTFCDSVQVSGIDRLVQEQSISYNVGLQLSFGAALNASPASFSNSFTDFYFADVNNDNLPDLITSRSIMINHLDDQGNPSFDAGDEVHITMANNECGKSIYRDGDVDPRLECVNRYERVGFHEWSELLADSIIIVQDKDLENYLNTQSTSQPYKPEEMNNDWEQLSVAEIVSSNIKEHGERIIPIKRDTTFDKEVLPIVKPIPADDSRMYSGMSAETWVRYPRLEELTNIYTAPEYKLEPTEQGIIVYELVEDCSYNDSLPPVDVVRVWVAEREDSICLTSAMHLLNDSSENRLQSRHADGVVSTIQWCQGVTFDNALQRLTSANEVILSSRIVNDTLMYRDSLYLRVHKGDVLMFRLSARDNHAFDDADWQLKIETTERTINQTYKSDDDFLCWQEGNFVAPQNGSVSLDIEVQNNQSRGFSIFIYKNGLVRQVSSVGGGLSHVYYNEANVIAGDKISIQIECEKEPEWSKVIVIPTLTFYGNLTGSGADTITYSIGSQILCDVLTPDVYHYATYKDLFGTLYKGWGQFAYNNVDNDSVIHLSSLSNYYNDMAGQLGDTTSLTNMANNYCDRSNISSALSSSGVWNTLDQYNAFSNARKWIPMYADSRSQRWITMGFLGAIGASYHSLSLQSTLDEHTELVDSVMYDSFIPIDEDGSVKHIRKSTWSYSPYISVSIPDSTSENASTGVFQQTINAHVSGGATWVNSDFMDMNGDGYPDFIGKNSIQYTNPWGGLGDIKANNFSPFTSSQLAVGAGYSGSVSKVGKQPTQNVKSNKTYNNFDSGEELSQSWTNVTYRDVNGDGLPDMIRQADSLVRYNIGYGFTAESYHIPDMQFSYAINTHGPASNAVETIVQQDFSNLLDFSRSYQFSTEQNSLSLGLSISRSLNSFTDLMVDINGDGYQDEVHLSADGELQVRLNNNNHSLTTRTTLLPGVNQSSTTYNLGTSVAVTIPALYMDVNPQATPLSINYSLSDLEWIDLNGDGFVDLAVRDSNHEVKVYYNANGYRPVNCLKHITNPTGQTINMEYRQSSPTVYHAGRSWELASVSDALPEGFEVDDRKRMSRDYQYKDAMYDTYEKSDYGYSRVSTIEYDDTLNSHVYRILTQDYANKYFINHGELLQDSLSDGNRAYIVNRYKSVFKDKRNNEINDLCVDAGIIRKGEEKRTYYYEGEESPGIITACWLEYDSLYNLIVRADSGDISIADDDIIQSITYDRNPIRYNNLISLPNGEVIADYHANFLRKSEMLYNAFGSPRQVVNHGSSDLITDLWYDIYGNLMDVHYGDNQRSDWCELHYSYDSVLQTYPICIYNQFGETQLTKYNLTFGVPELIIDPAGHAIRYRYDPMGRLIDVLAPNEVNYAATIHYRYDLPFHDLEPQRQGQPLDYSFPHISKLLIGNSGFTGAECMLYDARGTELQKKVLQNVVGTECWVAQGVSQMDHLGRIVGQSTPFVSTIPFFKYDPDWMSTASMTMVDYDIMDRKTRVTHPDNMRQRYEYGFAQDDNGVNRFRQGVVNELDVYSEQLLSPQGWLVQQNNPEGQITRFTYNPLGEMLSVVDADGYITQYAYDERGNITHRTHPDAGDTYWEYDAMGNVLRQTTANLSAAGAGPIVYQYLYNRLFDIEYPQHPDLDVAYYYYSDGRLARHEDATGWQEFEYDKLGNPIRTQRAVLVPTESSGFLFEHRYQYDAFGRMQYIVYPDGDSVIYQYGLNNLYSVSHIYNGQLYPLIDSIHYDEQGRRTLIQYGNGVVSTYQYNRDRNWLVNKQTYSDHLLRSLQDLWYEYDPVGNIRGIYQLSGPTMSFGGTYENHYTYDDLNRLVSSVGTNGAFDYSFDSSMSPTGRLGNKKLLTLTGRSESDLRYGYDINHNTHQPRVIVDDKYNNIYDLYWDANGNLTQMINCKAEQEYINIWDEENRLRMMLSPIRAGYYGYDAAGERIYKLTGDAYNESQNASDPQFGIIFDRLTVYPSPYITLYGSGYAKHFYVGGERFATLIGDGGLPMDLAYFSTDHWQRIMDGFDDQTTATAAFDNSNSTQNETINGEYYQELQYCGSPLEEVDFSVNVNEALLTSILYKNRKVREPINDIYYTHTDHLGSASWITDREGFPVQYLHYAPYGELIANQGTRTYSERFKFTGKERDGESGYDFFGARYYWSAFGIWMSVDPLAHKYPNVSAYLYCNGNPIMLVDPDGRDVAILLVHKGAGGMGHMAILIQDEDKVWHLYSKNGEGKAQSLGVNPNDRGEVRANSVADFLNNKADNTVTHVEGDDFPYYTAALIIKTSPEQDKIIQNGVEAKLDEPYNFFFNNCTEAVQKGLRDAGVNAIPTIIPIRSFYYMWYMIPDSQIIEPTTDEFEK